MSFLDDEPRDTIGMPDRKGHGYPGAGPRHAEQRESLDRRRRRHGLEVGDVILERECDTVPVGQAAATPVETDQRVVTAEQREPWVPDRALRIELEMMDPMLDPDERRPGSADRIGDARAIPALAEADLLPGPLHGHPRRRKPGIRVRPRAGARLITRMSRLSAADTAPSTRRTAVHGTRAFTAFARAGYTMRPSGRGVSSPHTASISRLR